MKGSVRMFVLVLASLVLLLALVIGAQAQDSALTAAGAAQPALSNGGTSSKTPTAAERAVEYSLWTKEAMAAAKPYALEYGPEPAAPVAGAERDEKVIAPVVVAAPGAPSAGADAEARAAYPEDWAMIDQAAALGFGIDSVEEAAGTSAVFTRYELNRFTQFHTAFPFRTIGRLNFTTWDNRGSYCTAAAMGSKNIIVTAAHCLYDTSANRWHKNWVFVPAYRNGAAPYGSFPYLSCRILNAYINLPGYSVANGARHDVGICSVKPNSAGQTLSALVGYLGLRYPGYPENVHDVGYPAQFRNGTAVPNAGRYTQLCTAETRLYTTDTLAWGCDLAGGMSGAPVIYRYAPYVVSGWIESVHSGGFSSPNDAHGARLKSTNIGALCTAHGGC